MTVRLEQDSQRSIAESLRALLGGFFDYAGLFPPAQLDMQTTCCNYARYLGGDHAWMLGRLMVPARRLDEFEQYAGSLLPKDEDDEPWQIGGLVASAGDPRFESDLERIAAFNRAHAEPKRGRAAIGVIELRAATAAEVDDALGHMPDELFPFFELPIDGDPRGIIAALAGSDAGAKVRAGGPRADLYPAPRDLARFIAAAAAPRVAFKATAGLHHPLRHHSPAAGTKEFGFLNLLVAAALALEGRDEADLVEALSDESLESFAFGAGGLSYRDHTLTNDRLERMRSSFAVAIGTCSFEEPREDLEAMGLM